LAKEKVLIVGLGEVGRPMFDLFQESGHFETYGLDLDKAKMRSLRQMAPPNKVDTVHICLPCSNQGKFVEIVVDYVKQFEPKLVIINSTIPPETTMKIYKRCNNCLIVHSPIRGVHKSCKHMKWEIERWTKYIGGANAEAAEAARKHFEKIRLKTKVLKNSTETELAKLFETTYRAWMVTCFQEMHRISTHFRTDFNDTVDFLEDTHRVRLDRPIMYPGEIGGHCLIPNVNLLLESYDSELLRLILKSNEKRKEEMKNKKTQKEAKKIKTRAENLQKELMQKWAKD
jgi:UDP-N-acetyl-D-mannosaminuronate dehydrogenase